MTAPTPITGVVARWTGRRRQGAPVRCGECGEDAISGAPCPGCRQIAGDAVAMMATVVDTPAGARLVIAERTRTGWTPTRTVEATDEAVRVIRRQDTATEDVTASIGGLW
jgi:hypothetical protein